MMKFIYDSLETVKKLRHPTKKDFLNTTIVIFVAVILASLILILSDTVFSWVYKWFYSVMK